MVPAVACGPGDQSEGSPDPRRRGEEKQRLNRCERGSSQCPPCPIPWQDSQAAGRHIECTKTKGRHRKRISAHFLSCFVPGLLSPSSPSLLILTQDAVYRGVHCTPLVLRVTHVTRTFISRSVFHDFAPSLCRHSRPVQTCSLFRVWNVPSLIAFL